VGLVSRDRRSSAWRVRSGRRSRAGGEQAVAGRWVHERAADGSCHHRSLDPAGRTVRIIRFDPAGAVLTARADPRQHAPEPADVLPLQALHLLQSAILGDLQPECISHLGGDEVIRLDAGGRIVEARLLEVLGRSGEEGPAARLAFETASGLLRRIVVRDASSDSQAIVEVESYEEIDGVRLPARLGVRSAGGPWAQWLLTHELSEPLP